MFNAQVCFLDIHTSGSAADPHPGVPLDVRGGVSHVERMTRVDTRVELRVPAGASTQRFCPVKGADSWPEVRGTRRFGCHPDRYLSASETDAAVIPTGAGANASAVRGVSRGAEPPVGFPTWAGRGAV